MRLLTFLGSTRSAGFTRTRWFACQPNAASLVSGDGSPIDESDSDNMAVKPTAIALQCDFDALPFDSQSLISWCCRMRSNWRATRTALCARSNACFGPKAASSSSASTRRVFGAAPTTWTHAHGRRTGRAGAAVSSGEASSSDTTPARLVAPAEFRSRGRSLRLLSAAVGTDRWLARYEWTEALGDRWWPVFGAVYSLTAVKRVRGMRLVGLVRQERVKPKAAPPSWPIISIIAGCRSPRKQKIHEHSEQHEAPTPAEATPAIARPSGGLHDGACKATQVAEDGALAVVGRARERTLRRRALTTNNRMELTAVIEALASLKRTCDVILTPTANAFAKRLTAAIGSTG